MQFSLAAEISRLKCIETEMRRMHHRINENVAFYAIRKKQEVTELMPVLTHKAECQ
jgi:hypothetical protein